MSKFFIFMGMLQAVGFFRGINVENSPYKFGKGNFWRVVSPLGFFLGLLISKEEKGNKVAWIIGVIFTLILTLLFFLM